MIRIASLLLASSVPVLANEGLLPVAFSRAESETTRVSSRRVDGCWERDEDPRADELRLPKRLCVGAVGVSVPRWDKDPFAPSATGLVDLGAGLRPAHIVGASRAPHGWDAMLTVLTERPRKPKCGTLSEAFVTVTFPMSLTGEALPGPVTVRGFVMDGQAANCAAHAPAVHYLYRPAP